MVKMAPEWLLIILLIGNERKETFTATFQTREGCVNAEERINKEYQYAYSGVRAFCTYVGPKRTPKVEK